MDAASDELPARPFGVASAFERGDDGVYRGALSEDWYQGRAVYGGLTAAILERAMETEAGQGRPLRSFHATFCAPATAGPAEVRVHVMRAGRSVAFVRSELVRDGEPLALATATFARERRSAIEGGDAPRLELPPVESVADGPEALYIPAFCRYFEFRQALGHPSFSGGPEAHVGGWCRARGEPVAIGAPLVLALLDAWAPAALSRHPRWAPCASIDMFVQLHASLDGSEVGWLGYEARSHHVESGYADERATLYFEDGRPIASARQLIAIFD